MEDLGLKLHPVKKVVFAKMDNDKIWNDIQKQARKAVLTEEALSEFYQTMILNHSSLESALSFLLAEKLMTNFVDFSKLQKLISEAFKQSPDIFEILLCDLKAIVDRDAAVNEMIEPFLFFKGFHALQAFRASHWFWKKNRKPLALFLQSRISEVFAVDIHPAATIGKGIFIDHATSVVIGETAIIEDNVSLLHEVTLGGTGKNFGVRHPHIGSGVLIGAGAKILGNIKIGNNAKIGAGSVILEDVPAHTTVVGVPGRITGHPKNKVPALQMNQQFETNY